MNAIIFAAGLGTRLRPLTNDKPKALIEINGMTLLGIALKKIENAGISRVVVNVHHFREQVIRFLEQYQTSGMEILVSDEREQLLDTGGGLLKARYLFAPESPVLLYNADIVTTANLSGFIDFHNHNDALVSLMVKQRPTSRHLLFDDKMQLSGWENTKTAEKIICRQVKHYNPFGFQGIHIINPHFFDLVTETGKFSIMKSYLRLAGQYLFKGFESKDDIWFDIGSPEKLQNTKKQLSLMTNEDQGKLF
jgi:NDP-sugar pyrophosphorylase family protein